jgi:hypothetical protein
VSFAASQTVDENYMQETYRDREFVAVPEASVADFDTPVVSDLTPEALEAKAQAVNEKLFGGDAEVTEEAPVMSQDPAAGADLDAAISSLLEEQFEEHADVATDVMESVETEVADAVVESTVADDVADEKPSQKVGKIAKNVQESLEVEEQKSQKSVAKGVKRWRDKAREIAGDVSAQTTKAAKKATDATGKATKSAAKAVSTTVESKNFEKSPIVLSFISLSNNHFHTNQYTTNAARKLTAFTPPTILPPARIRIVSFVRERALPVF